MAVLKTGREAQIPKTARHGIRKTPPRTPLSFPDSYSAWIYKKIIKNKQVMKHNRRKNKYQFVPSRILIFIW
jgi:hypothetical protein